MREIGEVLRLQAQGPGQGEIGQSVAAGPLHPAPNPNPSTFPEHSRGVLAVLPGSQAEGIQDRPTLPPPPFQYRRPRAAAAHTDP